MIPQLEYFAPTDLGEALKLLAEKQDAKILAGGTDVLTGFHQGSSRFVNTKTLVDINRIEDVTRIVIDDDKIIIGAAAPLSKTVDHPEIHRYFPLLCEAAGGIGSLQIRNRATLGGNFVNNAPCADSVPALLVYNAKIKIQSVEGSREMLLQDFLIKPYRTQLNAGELVTEVILQKPAPEYHGNFYKLGRRRGVAISRITMAVLLKMETGIVTDIRMAGGAVTPIGMRFTELESRLMGKRVSDALLKETSIAMGELILEKTGLRWSAPYKLPVMQQVCYQQLHKLVFPKEAK